jgi:hypothetical protein
MRLRATVRAATGNTRHLRATPLPDAIDVARLPDPITVEIVEQDGAFYLLRLNERGECIADTWHETVDAAKAQAIFEFMIEDSDWKQV